MKFIIGKKIEMTQIWQGEKVVAVTKILAGPCPVLQLKDIKKDGYQAVQLGFDQRKEKNINKPQLGHLKKAKISSKDTKTNLKFFREFRDETKDLKIGDIVDVSTFEIGDTVKVIGTSKGKGFQGSVKRHHFHGHNTTHGTKDQVRTSGAIGAGGPQHVFKGMRMAGRMGDAKVTISNLKIVQIDKANNILYISGAVPGARNSIVLISGDGALKIAQPEMATEIKADEVKPGVKTDVVGETKNEAKTEIAAEKKEVAPADKKIS
jgi:large subunit ribosomal protein L3